MQQLEAIEIDPGLPIPPDRGPGSRSKYPWIHLRIGDSFFVPKTTIEKMAANANKAAKRFGRRFTCRTMDGGVRVWRKE